MQGSALVKGGFDSRRVPHFVFLVFVLFAVAWRQVTCGIVDMLEADVDRAHKASRAVLVPTAGQDICREVY